MSVFAHWLLLAGLGATAPTETAINDIKSWDEMYYALDGRVDSGMHIEAGLIEVLFRGGLNQSPWRMWIHKIRGGYYVEVVAHEETVRAAADRLWAGEIRDYNEAWEAMKRTRVQADSGECPNLLQPIKFLIGAMDSERQAFPVEPGEDEVVFVPVIESPIVISINDEESNTLSWSTWCPRSQPVRYANDAAQAAAACKGLSVRNLTEPQSYEKQSESNAQ